MHVPVSFDENKVVRTTTTVTTSITTTTNTKGTTIINTQISEDGFNVGTTNICFESFLCT